MDLASLERWDGLRGVAVIRDVLRSHLGLELVIVDAQGPLPHQRGRVMRGSSAACGVALFARAGFSRCDAFYRQIGQESEGAHAECHLGLHAISTPVRSKDEVVAHLVVSGFSLSPDRAAIAEGLRVLAPDDPDIDAATRAVPQLDARDRKTAVQLLEACAREIEAFEEDRQRRATRRTEEAPQLWGMLGASPQMHAVFEVLPKLAESDATALVLGESGTGKELVARALHERGARSSGPFVAQNCGALPDDLLESALFGHVRGAFSGADRGSTGLFGAADRGTLFLDEVGEMSPSLQVKLLRVIQDGAYLSVGSTTPRKADVRVIAATHRDLGQMVAAGTFRQDLYYRLHVLSVVLPPLRDRTGDVRLLTQQFLSETDRAPRTLTDAAWTCMERYRWPGNVRELRAEIERWNVTAASARVIDSDHLSDPVQRAAGYLGSASEAAPARTEEISGTLADAIASVERRMIAQGLARTGGNRTLLAKELDISRTTLADRLKRYDLE